jgi:hypothetical protein
VEITWQQHHTDRLRAVRVGWEVGEAGGPCFPPDWSGWEPQPDDLHLLQIATQHGTCPVGGYVYRRPPEDFEFSPFVEGLPEESTFEFTDQHRALLSLINWIEFEDHEIGTPGADPKRPYGWGTIYQTDVAIYLGLCEEEAEVEDDDLPLEIDLALTQLHWQTQPALQVFLEHFEIPACRAFKGEDLGVWRPV